jgi:hypothetical protein
MAVDVEESATDKEAFLAALETVLEPVVRLMLKGGVTWKEFSELSKTKFIEVATAEFGIRGRPTNASRVAILTGLDRREVRRQRRAAAEPAAKGYVSKASQVLAAWYHDPDFLDANHSPLPLPLEGEGASVTELVRRIAPALPVTAMIKELRNAGALEELDDGRLRPLKRTYVPQPLAAERLRLWSSVLTDVSNTIERNFDAKGATTRFERRAVNLRVHRRAVPEFRALLEKEGQALLERFDDWLTNNEVKASDEDDDAIRLGLGIYQIEDRRKPRRLLTGLGNSTTRSTQ